MSQSKSRRVAHCIHVEQSFKKKKKKEILILKVWFYGNSVKLRQSPSHERWKEKKKTTTTMKEGDEAEEEEEGTDKEVTADMEKAEQ